MRALNMEDRTFDALEATISMSVAPVDKTLDIVARTVVTDEYLKWCKRTGHPAPRKVESKLIENGAPRFGMAWQFIESDAAIGEKTDNVIFRTDCEGAKKMVAYLQEYIASFEAEGGTQNA